ncbi:MAG: thioredoxin family protein [Myxococcota bacterium]|jgi:thioredoxin-related protein|nr:thioredoxin family protein [Myxococcota bacterium]
MRTAIILLLMLIPLTAAAQVESLDGLAEKSVEMLSVDGKSYSIDSVAGEKGTLLIFTCNHCPYVKAWEARTVELAHAALQQGVGVLAINANDPARVPEDGLEEMKRRAAELGLKYPYVVDEKGKVAQAFGATKTPEFFLFDAKGKRVYHGALDDNADDAKKVNKTYLADALSALLAGKAPAVSSSKAFGCGIKFPK